MIGLQYGHRTIRWVLLEFAAALARAHTGNSKSILSGSELEYILKQSQCKTIFLCKSFRTNPMWDIAYSVCKSLNSKIELINIKDIQNLSTGDLEQENFTKSITPGSISNTVYFWNYGLAKRGITYCKGLLNNAGFVKRAGMKLGDKFLNTMPLFHCAGSGMATLGCSFWYDSLPHAKF